uniref:Glutathione S-transferase sigma 3 n=1 Tax=Mytilus galloprovincialis TaxID=29158 RepID=J7IB22_MYTGA|nr:glutathione S-transferase sigma 3 [Mytilus galloprovincialis]
MPSYKLSYFKGKGRGELARLMFAAAGKEFEDERLAGEEWLAFKPKTPYGQMPVLTVDGKMINQSGAISRFLARELGLYGKDNMENTRCDVILETINDIATDMIKYFFEKDETKKAEALKTLKENSLPKFLKFLTTVLEGNGNKYLVGSDLTVADIAVFDILEWFNDAAFSGVFNDYSAIQNLVDRVKSIPNIKKYLESRPADS